MERIAALEAHIADLEARLLRLESSQQTRAVGAQTYTAPTGYGSAGIVGAPPIHTSFIDAR